MRENVSPHVMSQAYAQFDSQLLAPLFPTATHSSETPATSQVYGVTPSVNIKRRADLPILYFLEVLRPVFRYVFLPRALPFVQVLQLGPPDAIIEVGVVNIETVLSENGVCIAISF